MNRRALAPLALLALIAFLLDCRFMACTTRELLERLLAERILLLDGAMGTMIPAASASGG